MFNNNSTPFNMPVVPAYGNNGGFGGFGNDWLALIIILAIFGWGGYGNGFGGYGGGGQVGDNYVLASDMSQIERKIDGVYSGICDSTFALNNSVKDGFAGATNVMTQGFAGINTALVQQGYDTRNAITQDTIANMQGFNGVNGAIKDVNYNVATQANGITNAVNTGFCQTNFNNQQNTRDLLENQNANARAILDAINSNKVEALKDKIAEQNQIINALNLSASQTAQNSFLIEKLNPNPCPTPAYVVQPPQMVTFPYGASNGCGCA